MGLSLDAIYQPLNDFFLKEFGGTEAAPVKFRFSRTAHTLDDSDFLPPLNPQLGPSAAMAEQIFSIVVDGIPTHDPDGRTVWIGPGQISDLYHDEILGPSLPFVPTGVTADADKQTIIDSFSQVKADARLDWEHSKASSLLPGEEAVQYRPTTPSAQSWWDKADRNVWIPKTFQITGAATTSGPIYNDQILRLKLDNMQAREVLLSRNTIHPVIAAPVTRSPPIIANQPRVMMMARPQAELGAATMVAARPMVATTTAVRTAPVRTITPAQAATFDNAKVLPIRERFVVQSTLGDAAPTQTVVSTNVTISFDYCLVSATRQWMHEAFLNNRNWYIPGWAKGELSANNGHGMPALPVGFVAIKNLKITAPWTPADITNLNQSIQFGPFKFDSTVVDGAIGHEGMQVVGWILRDMGDLPPNSSP